MLSALTLDAAHHVGEDAQRVDHRVGGVEQRFLVFLVVLVVGQRLALHQGQQAIRLPLTRPVLPRASSGTSGFFFCGMIELPVQKRSARSMKPNARAHPQHQFFRQARQVRHQQRAAAQNSMAKSRSLTASSEFSQTAVEAQLGGDELAVDRVGGAGQRGAPSGRRLTRLRQSAKRSASRRVISNRPSGGGRRSPAAPPAGG
jgi:hypothetical protein